MLEELLRLIAKGGVHSRKALADTLRISEALLDQMLEDLHRMGYLRLASESCCASCEHCSTRDACAVGHAGRVWVLTEAGQAAAR